MKLELGKSQNKTAAQALVVFSSQTKKGEETTTKIHHPVLAQDLQHLIKDQVLTGKAKEVISLLEKNFSGYRHVFVVGLGAATTTETLRQAGAAVCKAVESAQCQSVHVEADAAMGTAKDANQRLGAFAEGLVLCSYKFDELKSKKPSNDKNKKDLKITLITKKGTEASTRKAFERAVILGETVNFAKRLGDLPGNLMTPTLLAESTVEAAKGTGVKVTVWDKARIKKERMGGLLGVAQGSAQEPRFIIMEYKGAAQSKKPLVFVGKGLTFDTGGISIKPSAAMEEMKYDMCGGANVIAAVLAMAKLKLKVNVVGLVAATENMPGSQATKPGDVHVARNGKSFEVNNTDAEGRLILSDALSYGSELNPQLMVDAATLTGAMVMALGNVHTGFFTRDQKLRAQIKNAAHVSGELVWNMPLTDAHVDDMKGTFADLSNISSGKGAGSATAAAFLEQFVGEGIPWAHFDIAGTAWAVGNRLNYCTAKGASGVMVRTFVELASEYQ